ncbi:MAG: lipid A biosynthesis (KDO)2-(lauroyl)-lipid IVA acyltransferase [Bacteroidales bacterium]|nr:lipid A biosynthesis (KDO)2-(lauroyl)-lipid IVA acyltransferase [Candidatus Colimorpha onthohippi]
MVELRHDNWAGKTDGTSWMQRLLIVVIRFTGLRIAYVLMSFVIPFYMILNRKGYVSIKHYFQNRHGDSYLKAVWHVYRNHFAFGQVIIDRFAAYGGMKFNLEISGYDLFNNAIEGDKGVLMLSSHVGNYELAGYMLVSRKKKFYAVLYDGDTNVVMQNRQRILSQNNICLVPLKEDMSHLFTINAALDTGDIVSIPADRVLGSSKTVECEFMGSKAVFPLGPFKLATHKNVPVFAVFVLRSSPQTYKVYIKQISVLSNKSNNERCFLMAQKYASELESVVKKYPYQWFNYYDFWQNHESVK